MAQLVGTTAAGAELGGSLGPACFEITMQFVQEIIIMTGFADVLKSPLELPTDDRAALAYKLLASLDELDEVETERLWAEEARRRREQNLAGGVVGSDAHAVTDKASRLFR